MAKIALQRVFTNAAQDRLLAEGDEDAAFLLAHKGLRMKDEALVGFQNVDEFFGDPQDTPENHKEQPKAASEPPTGADEPLVTIKRADEAPAEKPKNRR